MSQSAGERMSHNVADIVGAFCASLALDTKLKSSDYPEVPTGQE